MIPTFFTTLALGTITNMVATIMALAAWLPGSAILQGNLFFDSTNNLNPGIYVNNVKTLSFTGSSNTPLGLSFDTSNSQAACLKYGNNFYDCYQESTFISTGSCVAGGCAVKSYNVASVTKPYSGSGSIKKVLVTCDKQPVATRVDVDQVSATTGSGVGFMNDVAIGSGVTVAYGSGGGILWRENRPVVKVSASARVAGSAGVSECQLQVWSSGTYDPS